MRLRLRIRLQNKLKSNNYSELAVINGMASLIKMFMTYKTVTKGIDIFNFFSGKKNAFTQTQSAMNAFFQSALNGTMQVKDGFLQIGEAEKQIFNNSKNKSGFGKSKKDTFQWCLCKPHHSKVV